MNLEDPTTMSQPWLKVLIYGHAGSGKTTFAVSGPKTIVALVEEQGKLAIQYSMAQGWADPGTRTARIAATNDLYELLEYLKSDENDFNVLVLDSLTEMQDIIRREVVARTAGKETASLQDWGLILDKTAAMVRTFRDLPMHVIVLCTADETVVEDERSLRPALVGKKLPNQIAGFFNLVGYLFKRHTDEGEVERKVLLQGDDRWVTKEHPALEGVESVNLQEWIDKVAAASGPRKEESKEGNKTGRKKK